MLDFDELEEIETQLRIAPDASCDEASTFGVLNCWMQVASRIEQLEKD